MNIILPPYDQLTVKRHMNYLTVLQPLQYQTIYQSQNIKYCYIKEYELLDAFTVQLTMIKIYFTNVPTGL